ncbi:MAG: ATP phosphoribosyltransferase regulatory subunit [Clostridia bacterium]|nr:ATP phosphoribosyltransferase regulatory subunit [Clostridia bacterium]
MRKFYKITPEGTRDLLFEECEELLREKRELREHFASYGYKQVNTPNLEYYDVFNVNSAGIAQEKMFKLTDGNGRIMVLRPDNTFPIARLVSTSLQHQQRPIRIAYNQSVHSVGNSLRGKSCQFEQSGIELIGADGKAADLEVITIAIETMKRFGANFRFEIGHAQVFKTLIAELPIDADTGEEIRRIIEQKNYPELSQMLEGMEQTKAVVALKKLPRLFGGVEILDRAAKLCEGLSCVSCLEYLREIYNDLSALGYGDSVIIDLGLVNRTEYYTGVIFGCYVNTVGDSVLSGGRYDNLLEQFGTHDPAIGFAVNLSAMTSFAMKNITEKQKAADILVACISGKTSEVEAVKKVRELIAANPGKVVISGWFDSKNEAEKYAEENIINETVYYGEGK